MSQIWIQPKTWLPEGLTAGKLNRYLTAQNNYLRYRNRASVSYTAADIATGSATLVAVDDNFFKLYHTVAKGADVLFSLSGTYQLVATTNVAFFDVFVDDNYYLSSGTATPLARGLLAFSPFAANVDGQFSLKLPILSLSEGAHSFSLHFAALTGTLTLRATVNPIRMQLEDY